MSSPPTVSICIPTRNRAADLGERLSELRRQTYEDLEILVVDDCSDDDTPAVVAAARVADPRVRYVRPPRPLRVPGIVERGIAEARSDLVALFHDHDRYRPDAVERLLRVLEEEPRAGFAFSGIRTIDPATGEVLDVSSEPGAPRIRHDVTRHFVRTGSSMVGASAVLLRRDRLPTPVFDPRFQFFSDVDLWCRLSLAAPAAYEPGPLVDVVGWSEAESLAKLNWPAITALAQLRADFARRLGLRRAELLGMLTLITLGTANQRLRWVARVVRHARRSDGDLSVVLRGAPVTVRTLVAATRPRRTRSS